MRTKIAFFACKNIYMKEKKSTWVPNTYKEKNRGCVKGR